MYPAIHIFGQHVYMYSVMIFFGIVAYFVCYYCMIERGEKLERHNSNRLLIASVAGIAVLGLSALIFNSIFHSIEEGKVIIGGITWLGGVVGCFPFMVFAIHKFVPKAKGNAVNFFSLIIPGIVLGHAFGRMGCFLGGCCYGKVTDSPLGVVFPSGSSAAKKYPGLDGGSLPVYPTQLFEAAFEFLLFLVMVLFRKKLKYYNVEIYLFAYSAFRFGLEFMRGDDRGSTGFALSPAQVFCFIAIVVAVLLVLYRNGITSQKLLKKRDEWRKQAENAPIPQPSIGGRRSSSEDAALALKELHNLKKSGAITKEEYEEKKADLLKRI